MKFKNIKKKGEKEEKKKQPKLLKTQKKNTLESLEKHNSGDWKFPKIYRFITENNLLRLKWQKRQFWLQVVSVVSFLGFMLVCANIYDYHQLFQNVKKERIAIEQREIEWEGINSTRPGYRDGLLEQAMLNFQLGNFNKAKLLTQQALNIDPNYVPAQKLAVYLGMTEKEKIEN